MKRRHRFIATHVSSVVILLQWTGCTGPAFQRSILEDSAPLWVREELYFGADIPGGGLVTDSLWEDFVDREVVSRFPDGFTTLAATGRYKYKRGETTIEPTRIIVIYYPPHQPSDSLKVEEIIDLYKKRFSQESVLRVRNRVEARF